MNAPKSPSMMATFSRDGSPPSQRQLRVGEVVRHVLAELLARGEVHDPDIEGMTITVPEVRMSSDLKLATCYVVPLGGRGAEKAVAALTRHARFLRGEVGRALTLRHTPELRFRIDESFAEGERIDALLRSDKVKRDVESDAE